MKKSKHKPKNFLRYLLEEYILFRKEFYFDLKDSPEKFIKRLDNRDFVTQKWFQSMPILEHKLEKQVDIWNFELIAKQVSRRGSPSQSAKAYGTIHQEGEAYVLEGQIHMGSIFYWIAIIYLMSLATFIFWNFNQVDAVSSEIWVLLLILSFFAIFILFFWFTMFSDRNYLYQLIEKAANPEKAKNENDTKLSSL